eukprot:GO255731.1.p2 GENE.GO255731.1~~GO255731.1.p2  ORF type:complete len:111 (+),score=6.41 GO255731.1:288-620(+)
MAKLRNTRQDHMCMFGYREEGKPPYQKGMTSVGSVDSSTVHSAVLVRGRPRRQSHGPSPRGRQARVRQLSRRAEKVCSSWTRASRWEAFYGDGRNTAGVFTKLYNMATVG